MAISISVDDIKGMSVLKYSDLRQTVISGDLIFTSGDYLISQAIRKVTKSPWSHVRIVFRLDDIDRVLLLESVEDMGVRFAPLSKYLKNYEKNKPYKGKIVLARCSDVNDSVVNKLAQTGIDELTMPYDKDEIAKIMARVILNRGKWKKDREYICSELVYECFLKAGKVFKKDRRGFISPENIWTDEKLSLLGRIL